MHRQIDSAPAPSGSGNPTGTCTPGTAGVVGSGLRRDASQEAAIEVWEGEGGSVPSTSDTASNNRQSAGWHRINATARARRLPPWLPF